MRPYSCPLELYDGFLSPASATPMWKPAKVPDMTPIEPCSLVKLRIETSSMSAKKLRCSPEYSGIRLISDKVPARIPASFRLDVL